MPGETTPTTGAPLLAAWRDLKEAEPQLRLRDGAERLGVGEAALLEARRGVDDITPLAFGGEEGFAALPAALKTVGRVMALTRNAACVHETYGDFQSVRSFGHIGQVVGPIDLRLFFGQWRAVYAVTEELRSGLRSSIQIFDAAGDSVLKIYQTEDSDKPAWDAIIERHARPGASSIDFEIREAPQVDRHDSAIDVPALKAGWAALAHTHETHRLLRDLGCGREQALRLLGPEHAERLDAATVPFLLETAAQVSVPLMLFAGNPGCIQIFSGPVQTIKPMGPWLNVLDPDFHMHLRLDMASSVWRVRKPTAERGRITSIELFDAASEPVLQVFGQRPPGNGENPAWRALAETPMAVPLAAPEQGETS